MGGSCVAHGDGHDCPFGLVVEVGGACDDDVQGCHGEELEAGTRRRRLKLVIDMIEIERDLIDSGV